MSNSKGLAKLSNAQVGDTSWAGSTPGRHRTDLLLLRANVSNLGSLGCFFWILAKAPADMLSLRSDQLGGLDVVCGLSMWRAASTSRGSAKRRSSHVKSETQKGTS